MNSRADLTLKLFNALCTINNTTSLTKQCLQHNLQPHLSFEQRKSLLDHIASNQKIEYTFFSNIFQQQDLAILQNLVKLFGNKESDESLSLNKIEYDNIVPIDDQMSFSSIEEIPTFQHNDDLSVEFNPNIEVPPAPVEIDQVVPLDMSKLYTSKPPSQRYLQVDVHQLDEDSFDAIKVISGRQVSHQKIKQPLRSDQSAEGSQSEFLNLPEIDSLTDKVVSISILNESQVKKLDSEDVEIQSNGNRKSQRLKQIGECLRSKSPKSRQLINSEEFENKIQVQKQQQQNGNQTSLHSLDEVIIEMPESPRKKLEGAKISDRKKEVKQTQKEKEVLQNVGSKRTQQGIEKNTYSKNTSNKKTQCCCSIQ